MVRFLDQAAGPRAKAAACRIGAASLIGLIALGLPVQAQRRPDLDALRALRIEREAERDRYRQEAAEAAREIAALRLELASLGRAQVGGEAVAGDQRLAITALETREAALTARAAVNRTDLARLLGALQAYERDPPPALLVSPRSALDAARATILVRALQPELQRRAAAFQAQARALTIARRDLALAGSALATVERENADRRLRIERLLAEKSALERRRLADADAANAGLAELAAQARSLGDLMARLPIPGPDPAAGAAPSIRLGLLRPVAGAVVRGFGGDSRGLRFRTDPGAAVISPFAARVDYAGPLRGWGGVLILSGPDGYHVVLAGLQAVASGAGRPVAAGEPVGRMASGSPGDPAPELYLEVRRNGEPVDPARFMNTTPRPVR